MWKVATKRPRRVRSRGRWKGRWSGVRAVGVTGLVLVASGCGDGITRLVPVDTGQRLVCDEVILEGGGFTGVDRNGCWVPNRGGDEELWVERSDPGEDLQRQVLVEPDHRLLDDPDPDHPRVVLDTRRGHEVRLLR